MITIFGGSFQDIDGTVVANGTLVLQLNSDGLYIPSSVPSGQICAVPFSITLDDTGNVPNGTPIISNAEIIPNDTFYFAKLYDSKGELVWQTPQIWTFDQATGSDVNLDGTTPPTIEQAAGTTVAPSGILLNDVSSLNKLIVVLSVYGSSVGSTCSDDQGNSYSLVSSSTQDNDVNIFIYLCDNPVGADITVSGNFTGSSLDGQLLSVLEVSNLQSTSFDKDSYGRGTTSTSLDSGNTAAITQASELVLGVSRTYAAETNPTASAGTGYAAVAGAGVGSSVSRQFVESKTVSAIAVQSATVTLSGAPTNSVMGCLTFKGV